MIQPEFEVQRWWRAMPWQADRTCDVIYRMYLALPVDTMHAKTMLELPTVMKLPIGLKTQK